MRNGSDGEIASVRISVSRVRAATRGVAYGAPAIILGLIVFVVLGRLRFSPTGFSNRLVDFSIAAMLIPLAGVSLYAAFASARHFLLSAWPFPLGIVFAERSLGLYIGPFGRDEYDVHQLDVRYPFEQSVDLAGGLFEAFLPVDEQMATLLPRISLGGGSAIDRRVLHFAAQSEEELAGMVRDLVAQWRAGQDRGKQAAS